MAAVERSSATFAAEYVDPASGLKKTYTLSFWAADGSVSLFDRATKRTFLRRVVPTEVEPLTLAALRPGATVAVCGRQLKIIDCADESTRVGVEGRSSTLVIVKAYNNAADVLDLLAAAGTELVRVQLLRLDAGEVAAFRALNAHAGAEAPESLQSEHLLAAEVAGPDCVATVHQLCGPADPRVAATVAPQSIRALYGRSRSDNAVYTSLSATDAGAELAFAFSPERRATAVCTHCGVCIIKPHAVAAHAVPAVLRAVLDAGLEVSAIRTALLGRGDATDLLEAHRGVVREYEGWVAELASGASIIIEVRGPRAAEDLRALAGPYDPAVARALAPASLRARLGVDATRNGVHVTDAPEDGPLEARFLFHVLPAEARALEPAA